MDDSLQEYQGDLLMSVVNKTMMAVAGQADGGGLLPEETIVLGQIYRGGYYAGRIRDEGTTYMILAGVISDTDVSMQSSSVTSSVAANNRTNGPANTLALVLQGTTFDGAAVADNYSFSVYNDWYLPARDELEVIWRAFRFPVTARTSFTVVNNFDGAAPGLNVNSVPRGRPYYLVSRPSGYAIPDFPSTMFSSTLYPLGGNNYFLMGFVEGENSLSLERLISGTGRPVGVRRELFPMNEQEAQPGDYTNYSGFYCGMVILQDSTTYKLYATKKSVDLSRQYRTVTSADIITGDSYLYDGIANTDRLLAGGDSPAATFADRTLVGESDQWYVPAIWELYAIYSRMGSILSTYVHQSTVGGQRPWAVLPLRTANSGGNAQSKVRLHREYGIFSNEYYLSSTQDPSATSNYLSLRMSDGAVLSVVKISPRRTKLVRRVAYGPSIGDPYRGGYYAGIVEDNGVAWRLIVAPKSSETTAQISTITIPSGGAIPSIGSINDLSGVYSLTDGKEATRAMQEAAATGYPAANDSEAYSISGYSDWYVPSRDELTVAYWNLKPSTTLNAVGSPSTVSTELGHNVAHGVASGLPPRSAYSTSNPARTGVSLFISGASEAFNSATYWSSSSAQDNLFWGISFGTGEYIKASAISVNRVRYFRREPVGPDIGEFYNGGYVGGYINDGGIIYRIIVAPKVGGESAALWNNGASFGNAGAFSLTNGLFNTNQMIANGIGNYPAARFCAELNILQYDDWYLPAREELELIIRNLANPQGIAGNRDGSGGNGSDGKPQGYNAYSVPSRLGFSSESPGLPTNTDFLPGGSEAFDGYYWSSTALQGSVIWYQNIVSGQFAASGFEPTNLFNVRAVRRERV